MTNGFAAPVLTIVISIAVALVLLGILAAALHSVRTPEDFYVAGRRVGVGQNSMAMLSSFVMLTTLFTMTGHIALNGFDALIFAAGFSLSWLVALLFLAEPVRNTGGYTIGDLFAVRARERPARTASAVVTLLLFTTYIIITTNALGIVAGLLLNLPSLTGQALVVAVVGALITLYVFLGGMVGTTRLLVAKAALVGAVMLALTAVVLVKYQFNLLHLLGDAETKAAPAPSGFDLLGPGRQYGGDTLTRIGYISKLFTVVAGQAALPYLFMRNNTVSSGRAARRSVAWAGSMMVPFYLCTAILGFGAVGLLGGQSIGLTPPGRDITLPKLADKLGGHWVVGLLGAVALLIVAGIIAALLMSAATSFMRDIYAARRPGLDPATELRVARRSVLAIGIGAIILGIALLPSQTHFLIPTTVNFGAAAVMPAVVYSLFWKRFNTVGLRWSVYGGIAVTAVLVLFSVGVSGDPGALFPTSDFHVLPNIDVGLITVPITFLLGYLGTISSRERNDAGFAELQVRALTGAVVPRRDAPIEVGDPATLTHPGELARAGEVSHRTVK